MSRSLLPLSVFRPPRRLLWRCCYYYYSSSSSSVPITDASLLRADALVGGRWVGAGDGRRFDVRNPATGEVLARVADVGEAETDEAIAAAAVAFRAWRDTTAKERADLLKRWFALVRQNTEDLATILTLENGKPLAEARGEIAYSNSYIEWFAEEARRAQGDIIPTFRRDSRVLILKQPVGVCGLITPFNFPSAMLGRKMGPALAAGCTVVVKPSEDTPLSALALAVLAERAGVPPGVINVLPCSRASAVTVGRRIATHPDVRKVSFTGSTAVGKLLMGLAAQSVKRISMELGGNAPVLIFDDADLDVTMASLRVIKFRSSGQTCICGNRILVQDGIYDQFVERFRQEISQLIVGDGMEAGVQIGPLINERAIAKVERLIDDATSKGARIVMGGKRHSLGGLFFEPTILTNVSQDMDIAREEIFAPVAAIYRFGSDAEALRMANGTPAGLASYFFTRDYARIWRVAESLESGLVGVNEGAISTEVAPFGGWKESGIGREGSKYGIDDYLEKKYVCVGGIVPS